MPHLSPLSRSLSSPLPRSSLPFSPLSLIHSRPSPPLLAGYNPPLTSFSLYLSFSSILSPHSWLPLTATVGRATDDWRCLPHLSLSFFFLFFSLSLILSPFLSPMATPLLTHNTNATTNSYHVVIASPWLSIHPHFGLKIKSFIWFLQCLFLGLNLFMWTLGFFFWIWA